MPSNSTFAPSRRKGRRTGDPWRESLRFFLLEYLPAHRGASPHTVESYGFALESLVRFLRANGKLPPPWELSPLTVLDFLAHLENVRRNTPQTRNQRLGALRSFFKALSLLDPKNHERYETLRRIPAKRAMGRVVPYLKKGELRNLLLSTDPRHAPQGFRDNLILRYMYNTGSRISEVTLAQIPWLQLEEPFQASIRGKGGSLRICPLWETTAQMLKIYLQRDRIKPLPGYEDFLFINRNRKPFSRGGLWKSIRGYLQKAGLSGKGLSPHSIRHTTAVHLLQARVDINTIRSWLGHKNSDTTSGYLEVDIEEKRRALDAFLRLDPSRLPPLHEESDWMGNPSLLQWLENL